MKEVVMSIVYDENMFPGLKSNGYTVQMTNGRKLSTELHEHTFYEFIMVLSGSCIHRINGMNYLMNVNDIAILLPGNKHCFVSQEADTNVFAISVSDDEVKKFCEAYCVDLKFDVNKKISISANAQYEIMNIYKKMISCDQGKKVLHYKLAFGKIIHYILGSIHEWDSYIPDTLSFALNKITDFEFLSRGVEALEYLSGYSRVQLIRLMKKHVHKTPHEYITEIRMNSAYELIMNSGMKIDIISNKLGYSSVSHFEKKFKEYYHISPIQLRKQRKLHI